LFRGLFFYHEAHEEHEEKMIFFYPRISLITRIMKIYMLVCGFFMPVATFFISGLFCFFATEEN